MKNIKYIFLVLLFGGCVSKKFNESADIVFKSSGAQNYTIGTEQYINSEGTSLNKIRMSLFGVPNELIVTNDDAVEYLEQSAVVFYHNIFDKHELEAYDGIEIRATNTNGEEHSLYFVFSELAQVHHQLTLLETVIDEINNSHSVNWSNSLFHSSLSYEFKKELDDFINNDLNSYGRIQRYYLLNFKVQKSPSQKFCTIKYVCETEKKSEFYMDFVFEMQSNQIVGLLAHNGSLEFDFTKPQ